MESGNGSGPTGREWGDMARHVEEIRHDLRNHMLVIEAHQEALSEIEKQIATMSAKMYTAIAVTGTLVTAGAWIISFLTRGSS